MTKLEFLEQLSAQLCHLPPEKVAHARHYHSGLIDGRIEAGKTEEEAVEMCGSVENAALAFINRISSPRRHRISVKIKQMPQVWRIFFTVLLTIACYLFITVLWAAYVAVWALCGAIGLLGVGGVLLGVVLCFIHVPPIALCVIGAGLVLTALSLLLAVPSRAAAGLCTAITRAVNTRVRALLAKEALSV